MRISVAAIFLVFACVEAEYVVLHAPDHVNYLPENSALPTSQIPSVISSTYGFQVQKDMSWSGLGAGSVFKRPKANVIVSVESLPTNGIQVEHRAVYQTTEDDPVLNTEPVVKQLEMNNDSPLVVDFTIDTTVLELRSHHPHLFTSLPSTYSRVRDVFTAGLHGWSPVQMGSLNFTRDADLLFMGELYVMKSIARALLDNAEVTQTRTPDFFHLKVSGLSGLIREYGLKSQQVEDAIELLNTVLAQVTSDFKKLYNENVVVQVLGFEPVDEAVKKAPRAGDGAEESLHRQGRSLMQEAGKTDDPRKILGLAPQYDFNYPVAFNLFLWILLILALALFAVSYGIWGMDPGRDSIIYRMTSQRIKKD